MTRRARLLALLLVLVGTGTYYVSSRDLDSITAPWRRLTSSPAVASPVPIPVDQSATLPFDLETRNDIRHYFQGVTVDPQENNVGQAIQLDQAVGRPQLASGQYREAYRTYQKVLAISYKQANPMGIGIALSVLATVAQRANHPDEALAATMLAYKVTASMHDKQETGVAELSVARQLKSRDSSLAQMWLLRAREDLKDSGYKEDYVRLMSDLASSLKETHQEDQASKVIAEAWERAQPLGNTTAQKWAKAEVATVYADDLIRTGEYDKAVEVLGVAQGVFTPSEKSTDTYTALISRRARAEAGRKNAAEAGRDYLQAYANYELTRAGAPGDEGRAFLDKNHKELVDDFVAYHAQSRDYAAALALLESNKARTLSDVFEDPSYKDAQDQWKQMERRQAQAAADLLQAPADELNPNQARDTFARFVDLSKKHEDERRQMQTTLQLKETIVTPGLSKDDVVQLARLLPADVAVLSFFVGGKQASVFLLTNRGIQYFAGVADSEETLREIQQLRIALTNPYNPFYREPAQWLFKHLVQPAVRSLPASVKVLVYSPDDLLSRIPLEVLMDGERFLGERFAVYRVPSLRYARSIGAVKSAPARYGIACVDPDIEGGRLPFQQETGKALQALYGKNVVSLTGKDCSESRLQAAIAGQTHPAFLHIGAHGNFYPVNAMESAIYLSSDKAEGSDPQDWNAKAMATVDMGRIDLVTLSSCETGLTDPNVPRDVFGIARALFVAGAKSLVAPLWAIDDQATAEYMRTFHAAYGRNVPAVLALQQAQGALRRSAKYQHPFYWSAFVLTGATR
jgi:CHAT domain-containing protein